MISLSKGRRGPDVERWQRFLIGRGLLQGPADGVFGDKTDAATRAFQAQESLKPDGLVGAKTLTRAQQLGFAAVRRVRNDERSAALESEAKRILRAHWREPFGSEFPFQLDGKHYFGRIEQHYHPPNGPLKPWGYHTGVSLFVEITVGPDEPIVDDESTLPA